METRVVEARTPDRRLSRARTIVVGYLALSLLTLIALAILQATAPGQAGTNAWIRGGIVAATAALMLIFAGRAVAGHPAALLRWRIVVVVMLVAIAVIVSIPGFIPLWMRLEQTLCGIMLLVVAALIFGRRRP